MAASSRKRSRHGLMTANKRSRHGFQTSNKRKAKR